MRTNTMDQDPSSLDNQLYFSGIDLIAKANPNFEILQDVVFQKLGNKKYQLPEADIHIVPISSGVDSSVTALVLKALHPAKKFYYIFTDTGIEVSGTLEAIANMEKWLDAKIIQPKNELDLFQTIEKQGSYLPSAKVRYCTRIAKIKPYQEFLDTLYVRIPVASFDLPLT